MSCSLCENTFQISVFTTTTKKHKHNTKSFKLNQSNITYWVFLPHNTTLHPKSPLKICGVWAKFSQIFHLCRGVNQKPPSAASEIWNLAFQITRQIWNFTMRTFCGDSTLRRRQRCMVTVAIEILSSRRFQFGIKISSNPNIYYGHQS